MLGGNRSEQTGELNEAKVDRNVSLEVTPAKLKVSGIVEPVGLIKWIEFPFTLGTHLLNALFLYRDGGWGGVNESGAEEYTL